MDRQTTWGNFNGGWYSDIHVPDLKHISTYLTYLRYLSTYPYLTSSSCSGTTVLKVCTRYVCTVGLLFDTEIPAAVTFPQGARVNSVREQDSLVGDGHYLVVLSFGNSPFLLRATLVGMATALLSERGPLGELSSAPFIAISQGILEVGVYTLGR